MNCICIRALGKRSYVTGCYRLETGIRPGKVLVDSCQASQCGTGKKSQGSQTDMKTAHGEGSASKSGAYIAD